MSTIDAAAGCAYHDRMLRRCLDRLSLFNRGVFYQFIVGVAAISTIPLLSLWYLETSTRDTNSVSGALWPLVIAVLVLSTGLAGFLLLRRQPSALVKIRSALEDTLRGELRSGPASTSIADDVTAIEECMGQLVHQLRRRVQEVERERADLQEQLTRAQKIDSLRAMARGVAHDYNNLMAAILGNISIVIRNIPPDFEEKDNALQIEASALQAVELTNRIMAYTGRTHMDRGRVNVGALLLELQDVLKVSVARGVKIEYDLAAHIPDVLADNDLLRQALTNLVVNAGEANLDRAGTVTVAGGCKHCDRAALQKTYLDMGQDAGDYVFVEIHDTGCGMSPAVIQNMFDPFFSTKIRGQGLGLTPVMGLVRSHRGAISVDSEPGRGTCIRLLLPVAPEDGKVMPGSSAGG